jgi:hypothetical protein
VAAGFREKKKEQRMDEERILSGLNKLWMKNSYITSCPIPCMFFTPNECSFQFSSPSTSLWLQGAPYNTNRNFTAPSCPVGSPAKYRGLTQLLGCIGGGRVNIGVLVHT